MDEKYVSHSADEKHVQHFGRKNWGVETTW
jgi:hypothetical protein